MKLFEDDFVIFKNGKPLEPLHTIYHKTSMQEVIEDGFKLEEGEEWVSMTKLPKYLQDKYINFLKGEK
jgi:hypothetical protein